MTSFKGFADGKSDPVEFPAAFFNELLPEMADVDEIKLSLLLMRMLKAQAGTVQFVFLRDLLESPIILRSFGSDVKLVSDRVNAALEKALQRGTFVSGVDDNEKFYLLNTPRGRAALAALQKGSWQPGREYRAESTLEENGRLNIYQLYEANIGPLTPILAQTLEEAERDYPSEWIEEAIRTALKKNVRNWSYVEAILRSWKEKGRGEKDQRNDQENPRKYIEGDLADYIKH